MNNNVSKSYEFAELVCKNDEKKPRLRTSLKGGRAFQTKKKAEEVKFILDNLFIEYEDIYNFFSRLNSRKMLNRKLILDLSQKVFVNLLEFVFGKQVPKLPQDD